MQKLIVLLAASTASVVVHAVDLPPLPVPEEPVPELQSQTSGQHGAHQKATVVDSGPALRAKQNANAQKYEADQVKRNDKRQGMTEIERFAVREVYGPPRREEVLPYRFDSVTRLMSMLSDPLWSSNWGNIIITVAMAADKKAALELIEFIKNEPLPAGFEARASYARLRGIAALGYATVDQDIPEVLEFLQRLTDSEYVASLNAGPRVSADVVRRHAYMSLAAAATDESMAILEKLLSGAQSKTVKISAQTHSAGLTHTSKPDKVLEKDIQLLEMYMDFAKKRQAGLE